MNIQVSGTTQSFGCCEFSSQFENVQSIVSVDNQLGQLQLMISFSGFVAFIQWGAPFVATIFAASYYTHEWSIGNINHVHLKSTKLAHLYLLILLIVYYMYLIPNFIWDYSKIGKFVHILTSFPLLIQGFELTISRIKNGILVEMKRILFF